MREGRQRGESETGKEEKTKRERGLAKDRVAQAPRELRVEKLAGSARSPGKWLFGNVNTAKFHHMRRIPYSV